MFTKTSAIQKNDFFTSIVKLPRIKNMQQQTVVTHQKNVEQLYIVEESIYLKAIDGIAMLVVGNTIENTANFQRFFLHGSIKLHKGTFYNIISVSPECSVMLIQSESSKLKTIPLPHPIQFNEIMTSFEVPKIYSLYYQVKKAPYHYPKHQHPYYELTIVESGTLETVVDGVRYTLEDHDVMIYNSNQVHEQTVKTTHATSYITIMFETTLSDEQFFNRVFHINSSTFTRLEELTELSNQLNEPYQQDRLLALLKLFILLLPQQTQLENDHTSNSMQEKYDNERLQTIIDYIRQHPYTQVTNLVQEFGISRSSLQKLFHRYTKQGPRTYIEQQRFKQAKTLIRESSYSLNEIAQITGYSSLQAFSRAFKQHFNETPSHYARSVYKL